ncbi:MAG: hypothetical protein Pars2KO_15850 [Parasphingorhabdus sp.]
MVLGPVAELVLAAVSEWVSLEAVLASVQAVLLPEENQAK